jgi:hypothetical protein
MARRAYSQSPCNRWKYKSSGSEPDISNIGMGVSPSSNGISENSI